MNVKTQLKPLKKEEEKKEEEEEKKEVEEEEEGEEEDIELVELLQKNAALLQEMRADIKAIINE
jgi:hypothetical protein